LKRDQSELDLYQENAQNINSGNREFINILESRLKQQKRKILIKEELLAELKPLR
jgi:hypothetical protein